MMYPGLVDELKGSVALVTGSSRGIGRAIALALAQAGADVVLNFLRRAAEARAVELEIRQLERRCVTIQADVSSASDVERLIQTSEDRIGSIDVLVNNAGISRPQPIEEITEQIGTK
jgi:3-oxoacyl-[acyl-carrier protein] reductase